MTSVDLPEPETPVTQVKSPSGIGTLTFFRLLPRAPTMRDLARRIRPHAQRRQRDAAPPGEVLAGDRGGVGLDVARGTLRDQVAAVRARARTQVDDVVGGADGLLVVLDHDHRVAEIAQLLERGEQALVVALVQPDRGLIQDVHDAREAGADLAREADALRLPRPRASRRVRSSVR